MKMITLTKGYFAAVDDEDYDRVNQFKWHASEEPSTVYAARKDEYGYSIRLHRFVMNAGYRYVVDHKDGNGLNCTKDNLRIVTQQQNVCNSRRKIGKSGYRGVHQYKDTSRYCAYVSESGKMIYLGMFDSAIEAARARDAAASELYGESAILNFPHAE